MERKGNTQRPLNWLALSGVQHPAVGMSCLGQCLQNDFQYKSHTQTNYQSNNIPRTDTLADIYLPRIPFQEFTRGCTLQDKKHKQDKEK